MAGDVAGLHDFVKFGVDIVGVADAAEHDTVFLSPAALDEAVWCINDKDGVEDEEECWDSGEGERHMPTPCGGSCVLKRLIEEILFTLTAATLWFPNKNCGMTIDRITAAQ